MIALQSGIFLIHEQIVVEAAVDIEHFEIIVKAMLSWADEPKTPKKALGRSAGSAGAHDEQEDELDEPIVDEDDDDDDLDDAPRLRPASAQKTDAGRSAAPWPVSEQAD